MQASGVALLLCRLQKTGPFSGRKDNLSFYTKYSITIKNPAFVKIESISVNIIATKSKFGHYSECFN